MTVTLSRGASLADLFQVCIALPDDEQEQFEVFSGERYEPTYVAAAFFLRPGPKWTVVADGTPIVVAGFDLVRRGVWQDWMFSTPVAWERHWRTVTKLGRRVMDEMLRENAHRLQCVSLASRTQAHRWYRPLGLELEGTLRGYGINGEDALMFSRLRSS